MDNFEEYLHGVLCEHLLSENNIDAHWPECPDIEEKWEDIVNAYIPDGIREFSAYPTASLGWVMYVAMAMTQYWDEEWEIYSKVDNLYIYLRDKRGYDNMDEYIREEVLSLKGLEEYKRIEHIVGNCASIAYSALMRARVEPGTKEAFDAYVACLHQLYLMGNAVQLKRMGYHMSAL
ncbi:MAG: hypothetical protein J6Y72_11150 [Bacteroidales bacterium]|jgi:hypothetical protein|nr:hypothetical protein [Bacteroidales bacterium]MBP5420354.1 hypothetical protein [Bacteroidales bacterium]MCR5697129.1 hypothetical protein [Marinilabiliaceae bacterium]